MALMRDEFEDDIRDDSPSPWGLSTRRKPLEVFRRERLRVGVGQCRRMDFRLGHRIGAAPIMFGFDHDISAVQKDTARRAEIMRIASPLIV